MASRWKLGSVNAAQLAQAQADRDAAQSALQVAEATIVEIRQLVAVAS
jgi:hypothetical protein